jgi:hypothetical protein
MGLTVKVYPKEMEEFPGGLQFHRKKETMKRIMNGTSSAYIFHMSWTENKDEKLEFFKQMGEWYLKDSCINKGMDEIIAPTRCCSSKPIIKCYYRDKPSIIPCLDAPRITETGKAFYKAFTPAKSSFW